ncbi:MAG: TetR/AcrR family transcriptional regulator [Fimbriimonadales bacterium]
MSGHSTMGIAKHITKRDQQAEERRGQLIDVALELFSQKGWENTSIKDLAEAGGVAPGLFYHYFENKEDLLLAVFERHGFKAELEKVVFPAFERPASEVLLEVARAYFRLLDRKHRLVRIFVREAMTNPNLEERWIEQCNDTVNLLARYLAARVAAGELRPHNTQMSARMLTHPIVMLHLTGGSADELESLVQCLMEGINI